MLNQDSSPSTKRTAAAKQGAPVSLPQVLPAPETALAPPRASGPSPAKKTKQLLILAEAERQFARFGFEGVSLETIATALGISRQNMLYYYASKEQLYTSVLDDVLQCWLASMEDMARATEPSEAISRYVRAKLQFSRERPQGSAVFTREVMGGAPLFAEKLAQSVIPKLHSDVRTFERWAEQGKIARVDFTHLMFVIWSATQAYADLATQFALIMKKPALDAKDFDTAHTLITTMVLKSLGI